MHVHAARRRNDDSHIYACARAYRPIYFKKLTPILGSLFAGNIEAYRYLPQSVSNFVTARQIKHMMEVAGLRDVTVKELAMGSVAIISGNKH